MKSIYRKQGGFAMAAMLIGSAIVFGSGFYANAPEGTTMTAMLGLDADETTEIAAMESASGMDSDAGVVFKTSDDFE